MSGNTGKPSSASPAPDGEGSDFGAGPLGLPVVRDIEVAPDKIFAVADVIEKQAEALQRKLAEHIMALRISSPSEDIVSTHAVEAWNEVITGGDDSYEGRVRAYVRSLGDLAEQLRAAGRKYLESEGDKAATFGDRRDGD